MPVNVMQKTTKATQITIKEGKLEIKNSMPTRLPDMQ